MRTRIVPGDQVGAVARAAEFLRAGEIVGLPTETVYGLAGAAVNAQAVARIFQAKARPAFDPLIVHVANLDWLNELAVADRKTVRLLNQLTSSFWPGPLTILLPKSAAILDLVTSGLPNVAVRMPAHPLFQAVLREFGGPLAAPSANRFGRISPTTAAAVHDELGGLIPLILDDGPTTVGIESTVIEMVGETIRILRPGPITEEILSQLAPVLPATDEPTVRAPGQLPSHYSPITPLRFLDPLVEAADAAEAGLLTWGRYAGARRFAVIRSLSERADFVEAAANLFAMLRWFDQQNLTTIYVQSLPKEGLGRAIMNRLERASVRR